MLIPLLPPWRDARWFVEAALKPRWVRVRNQSRTTSGIRPSASLMAQLGNYRGYLRRRSLRRSGTLLRHSNSHEGGRAPRDPSSEAQCIPPVITGTCQPRPRFNGL